MIEWLDRVLLRIGNISAMHDGGDNMLNVINVSLAALTSLLCIEIQWNGLFACQGSST